MSEEAIYSYLLSEYQRRNGDFIFKSRKIARVLHLRTKSVGRHLSEFEKFGIVGKYRKYVWRTNFSHKEDPQAVPVKHWWNFLKN
jgi:DNA-binding MarR family transcriptional regulator